ncbi:MAG: hypothetical protein A2X01_19955 [Bacteroidetes bacterium GWF2_35_48]|nr:MAG: hypothetical protein A2X01_19955 [Bacteroidetes bacterium GWF2_35_48]
MKNIIFFFVVIFLSSICVAQQKKTITPSVFDSWKDLENQTISDDGNWISYEINPQKGDGILYIYHRLNSKIDSVMRGYDAKFSSNSDFLVFKIKAPYDTIRKAKLAKKKADDLPKDSIGIWILKTNSITKFPKLKSFKFAKENSKHITFLLEKDALIKDSSNIKPKDTTTVSDTLKKQTTIEKSKKKDKKTKAKKKKEDNGTLVIFNPALQKTTHYDEVSEYEISENGNIISYILHKKDTIADSSFVFIYNTQTEISKNIYKNKGTIKKITPDKNGEQICFIYSSDTTKVKAYNLFYWTSKSEAKCIIDTLNSSMKKNWCVSENGDFYFSQNRMKFFFYTAPFPEKEFKDSLTEDEKYKLDLWSWTDTLLQPNQLKNIEKDKKKSFLAVYFLKKQKMVQLASDDIPFVTTTLKGDGNIGIGYNYKPYSKYVSWITDIFRDVYIVDFLTGNEKLFLKKAQSIASISPNGNFVAWYNKADSTWNLFSIKENTSMPVTKNLGVNFWDEDHDVPSLPDPYGLAGWSKDDKSLLIYDRFDIWQISTDNKTKPERITKNFGRKNKTKFRYIELDKEALWINTDKNLLLKTYNEDSKQEGFYSVKIKSKDEPKKLIIGDYKFSTPQLSKKSNVLLWRKCNFNIYPNLCISTIDFKDEICITNANPQQTNYFWGSVELVKWKTNNNEELEGLLYKPENFNSAQKCPMIVYFYEKNSHTIHNHYTPKPSKSVINFPEYLSNGYLIFVPDIKYKVGSPGQDAYDAIMSGTDYIVSKGFVNEKKIGLQGQSWGGYQVAYLVTRTNRFCAAMAGAAVSNMISAYGGIRWTSGNSRMMQYENGQSRIGGTLWEKKDLYIENSPIFFADKIQTPLLMMNNDADGAVPWYQGIELFTSLRRLEKPVWLLNYNGDDHNLKRRANSIDLDIRMKQFFDHYLKDEPAPKWMIEGIPAMKKDKENGYDLVK